MNNHYQDILLAASGEILLLVDPVGLTILSASPATARLLGHSLDDLVGLSITEIECALADVFFWEEIRAGGAPDDQTMEGLYRRADGSLLRALKTVRRLPEGVLVRAIDVDAQRRTEDELAEMTSHLRATLEATADGILVVDGDGRIANMNRRLASLWGLSDELLARHDDMAILERLVNLAAEPPTLRDLLTGHSQDVAETFHTFPLVDGRVFEISSRPARHDDEVIGRVFCTTDVTERHRTEQALITARDTATAASKAKSDFLAMMSHEIRTPMNGIIGMAQLLKMTPQTDEQREYIATILSSSEALLSIINDILDYSKIEARKLNLEKISFDLRQVVADADKLFRPKAQEQGITFSTAVTSDVPHVLLGDPNRVRQILVNLISNAFKFTTQGQIAVLITNAEMQGGRVRLRVTVDDSGIGIAPEKCRHIFTPFEQADMSTTRRYGGTGLGLSICRMLCGLMDGEIGVESKEGVGSRFWFTIRLEVGATEETNATPGKRPILRKGTRILVAEDNPINCTVIARMLEFFGAEDMIFAPNGEEAVNRCAERDFDLIFMDARMPRMNGLAATRALREAGNATYIVGVSADAMSEERDAALASGMDDYIPKPISQVALAGVIERWRQRLIAARQTSATQSGSPNSAPMPEDQRRS